LSTGTSGRRVKGEDGGVSKYDYFIYMYENKIMKPVKMVLKRGKRGKKK
jgi:hypothetical protein